jgi:hypothetical protein
VDLKDTAALRKWVRERYQGRVVRVEDDGNLVLFGRDGIESSVKKRGEEQRQAYAGLDTAIENAVHDPDSYVEGDARHPHVQGQEVYYGAVRIGDGYYSVRFKLEKVAADEKLHYKDHKVTEIEIAPSLYAAQSQKGGQPPAESAIRGISLSVLKGDVKPSRMENGVLLQSAPPVGSEAFKRWFGNSKVVDENGDPLVVYHGTNKKLAQFDPKKRGSASGLEEAREGFWFSSSEDAADTYAEAMADVAGGKAQKYPVYLALQNPLDIPAGEMTIANALKKAKAEGHDGLILRGDHDGGVVADTYVAFSPTQIKSVFNRGAFDPNDPRILYQYAFAGSPTRGIRRMSTEYIGTGENTQNEGWGLYSSELKEIADWYRKTLTGGSPHLRRGHLVYREKNGKWGRSDGKSLDDFEEKHLRMLALVGGRDTIVNAAERRITAARDAGRSPDEKDIDIINFFRDTQDGKEGGQVYELDIPDNDVLLKREDTLAEQPEKVMEALRRAADSLPDDEVEAAMTGFLNIVLEDESNYTGGMLYDELAKLGTIDFGETLTVSTEGKKAASLFLNSVGIPGLRYLSGEDPNAHNFVIFDDKAVNILKTFYQSAESAAHEKRAKFEASPTAQVTGQEIFNEEKPFPEKMADKRNAVIAWLESKGWLKKWKNDDTGWDINVSKKGIRDTTAHGFGEGKAQVLAALPDLIKNAVYVAPGKKLENGNKRHIFAAKTAVGNGETFVVALVVEEDKNGKRFYNHELTEIENLDNPSLARQPDGIGSLEANRDSSVLDIVRSHLGVKPDFTLNAGKPDSPRGAISFNPVDDTAVVRLFKGADLSTVLHETGHIFMREMQWLMDQGLADEALRKDHAILLDWVGAKPGEGLTVDQQETFARGFEAWLREGKAPAKALDGAFARFRKWLTKIYKKASSLNVELTDDVRGVFDRLLATEREIATAAARNELLDLTARELDGLGLTYAARYTAAGLMPKARESAAESLRAARDQNRKQRLAKYYKDVLDEIREEPVHRARADMRKTPIDLWIVKDTFGDDIAASLQKKTPAGLKYDGGVAPDIFAAEHGFESVSALNAHRKAMLNMEFVRESRKIARREGVTRTLKRAIYSS